MTYIFASKHVHMYIEFQGKLEGKDFEENEMENNVSG